MKSLTFQKISELARNIEFYPLKILNWQCAQRFQTGSENSIKPDYTADIEWEDRTYKFLIELKTHATPKKTDEAIYRLKKYVSAIGDSGKFYPLFIAPYLSEERLERLIEEKISGLDLSGNGVVYVPGEIFVFRTGAENAFPSNAPIKNVFRGVSSLVGRVFFTRREYPAVGEVLKEIDERGGKTTFATVSKVLKTLEEELIISRKEGIRLVDGRRLLRNLRENYQKPKISRTIKGKSEDLEKALAKMSKNADESKVLFVVNEPQRYAVFPSGGETTKVYTENIEKVLREVDFSKNDRFPNLELIETSEQTVYFDRRRDIDEEIYYISPVQIYLELANGGKREKDTAQQVAENILNPQD
jgi:hypothetical protein